MQFVSISIIVLVSSTICTRSTEAVKFTSESAAQINYNKNLNLPSNAGHGFHITNAVADGLCAKAEKNAEIYDPVVDSADESCGYDVIFEEETKPGLWLNLLQCTVANDGRPFYLRKVKETAEGKNEDTDEYVVYQESYSLQRHGYCGSQEILTGVTA